MMSVPPTTGAGALVLSRLQWLLDVELHIVRVDTVKRLIETLQAHAAHEDAAMYPWAQEHLPLTLQRQLFVRIGRSLRALVRQ